MTLFTPGSSVGGGGESGVSNHRCWWRSQKVPESWARLTEHAQLLLVRASHLDGHTDFKGHQWMQPYPVPREKGYWVFVFMSNGYYSRVVIKCPEVTLLIKVLSSLPLRIHSVLSFRVLTKKLERLWQCSCIITIQTQCGDWKWEVSVRSQISIYVSYANYVFWIYTIECIILLPHSLYEKEN